MFCAGDNEYGGGFYESALSTNISFICNMFQFYNELSFMKSRN